MEFVVRSDLCNISGGRMICIICVLFRLASDSTALQGRETHSDIVTVGLFQPAQLSFSHSEEKTNKKCVRRETGVFIASLQVEQRQTDGASSRARERRGRQKHHVLENYFWLESITADVTGRMSAVFGQNEIARGACV